MGSTDGGGPPGWMGVMGGVPEGAAPGGAAAAGAGSAGVLAGAPGAVSRGPVFSSAI
jgi:hypothetical protein